MKNAIRNLAHYAPFSHIGSQIYIHELLNFNFYSAKEHMGTQEMSLTTAHR